MAVTAAAPKVVSALYSKQQRLRANDSTRQLVRVVFTPRRIDRDATVSARTITLADASIVGDVEIPGKVEADGASIPNAGADHFER